MAEFKAKRHSIALKLLLKVFISDMQDTVKLAVLYSNRSCKKGKRLETPVYLSARHKKCIPLTSYCCVA